MEENGGPDGFAGAHMTREFSNLNISEARRTDGHLYFRLGGRFSVSVIPYGKPYHIRRRFRLFWHFETDQARDGIPGGDHELGGGDDGAPAIWHFDRGNNKALFRIGATDSKNGGVYLSGHRLHERSAGDIYPHPATHLSSRC